MSVILYQLEMRAKSRKYFAHSFLGEGMRKHYLMLNVIAPLLAGASICYLFFPKTIFVEFIDEFLGCSYHIPIDPENIFVRGFRYYLPDFLWAYAFTGLVICLTGYDKRYIAAAFLFEVLMELIQLFPSIRGTFDVCDIITEMVASVLAIILSIRRTSNEKV